MKMNSPGTKFSYEEAEAYVRSDMAEVVETEEQGTENEDANEEEADVSGRRRSNLLSDNRQCGCNCNSCKKMFFPGNAEFVVTPIVQETDPDQYAENRNKA